MYRKYILTFLVIVISSIYTLDYTMTRKSYIKHIKELVLKEIKRREGFSSKPYKCAAGYLTVGYGHRTNDSNTAILSFRASKILETDIEKSIKLLRDEYNISEPKAYVLSSIVMNIGFGKFKKSKMDIALKTNNDSLLYVTLLKYSYYKSNGKMVRSTNLYRSRRVEVLLLKLLKYD